MNRSQRIMSYFCFFLFIGMAHAFVDSVHASEKTDDAVDLGLQLESNARLVSELSKPRISDSYRERLLKSKMSAKDRAYLESAMKAWRPSNDVTFQGTMRALYIHFPSYVVSLRISKREPLTLTLNENIEIKIENNEIRESIRKALELPSGATGKKSALLELLKELGIPQAQAEGVAGSVLTPLMTLYVAEDGAAQMAGRTVQPSSDRGSAIQYAYETSSLHTGLSDRFTKWRGRTAVNCSTNNSVETTGSWSVRNYNARYTPATTTEGSNVTFAVTNGNGQRFRVRSVNPGVQGQPRCREGVVRAACEVGGHSDALNAKCSELLVSIRRAADAAREYQDSLANPVPTLDRRGFADASASGQRDIAVREICQLLEPTIQRLISQDPGRFTGFVKEVCTNADCSTSRAMSMEEEARYVIGETRHREITSLLRQLREWRPLIRTSQIGDFRIECPDLTNCRTTGAAPILHERDSRRLQGLFDRLRELESRTSNELDRKGIHRDLYALTGISACCGDSSCRDEFLRTSRVRLAPASGSTRQE